MCGIVGYTGAKAAGELLLSSLELLEHRGYDSVGIAQVDSATDNVHIQKCVGRVRDLRAECEANPVLSTCGIGHTRWATHGAPSDVNSHPHLSDRGKIAVVHNGIIENFATLKKG